MRWFFPEYRTKDGELCNKEAWRLQGSDEKYHTGPMEIMLMALARRRAEEPDLILWPVAEDIGSTKASEGQKRYSYATPETIYKYMAETRDARNRCLYMILEAERCPILMLDMDRAAPCTREEFILSLHTLIDALCLQSQGHIVPADFIIDDTFDTDGRCSAHVLCPFIGFYSVEEAREAAIQLAKVPAFSRFGIDVGIPKRNGLFKIVGNCKRIKRMGWQLPNPNLDILPPPIFAPAQRASLPYTHVVSLQRFKRRCLWVTDESTIKWWPEARRIVQWTAEKTAEEDKRLGVLRFITEGERLRYYKRHCPFDLLWPLTRGVKAPSLGYNFPDKDGKGVGMARHTAECYPVDAKDWRVKASRPSTLSIHAVPPLRYWVWDLDVSDTSKKGGQPPVCVTRGNHDADSLCAVCWKSHVWGAVEALKVHVQDAFALDDPLYVYSGSKGIHVWYRLTRGTDLYNWLHDDPNARTFLLTEYMQASRVPGLDVVPWPRFDAQAVKVHHDPVPDATGRNFTGMGKQFKLPFSLHNKTGRPAMVIPDPRTTDGPPTVHATMDDFIHGKALLFAWLAKED